MKKLQTYGDAVRSDFKRQAKRGGFRVYNPSAVAAKENRTKRLLQRAGDELVEEVLGVTIPVQKMRRAVDKQIDREVADVADAIAPLIRNTIDSIFSECLDFVAERIRQDRQWGGAEHDDQHGRDAWACFIKKQLGMLYSGKSDWEERMIKIGALAMAAVASDRRLRMDTIKKRQS